MSDSESEFFEADNATLLEQPVRPPPVQYVSFGGNKRRVSRKMISTTKHEFYTYRRFVWLLSVANIILWWIFYIVSIVITEDKFAFSKFMRLEILMCFFLLVLQCLNYYNSFVSKDIDTSNFAKNVIPMLTLLGFTGFYMAILPIRIDHEYNIWIELSMPTFNVFGIIFFQTWLYCLQVNTSTIQWEMYRWHTYILTLLLLFTYFGAVLLLQFILDDFTPPYSFIFITEDKYTGYAIFFYVILICFFLSFITVFCVHYYYKAISCIKKKIQKSDRQIEEFELEFISDEEEDTINLN